MTITLVSGAQLINGDATSSPSWSSVTLPAGRLLMLVGYRAGASRQTTGLSHPAIQAAQKVAESAVAVNGQTVRVSAWEVTSTGGTGTLTVTHDGVVYQTLVQTLKLVGIGSLLEAAGATATSAASLNLSATASGAAHGVAVAVAEPVNGGATLNASNWNDVSDHRSAGSGYAQQRLVAESGSVSGQTVTVSMSSGDLTCAAGLALLFADPVAGGGGGTGAAALMGAIPGV